MNATNNTIRDFRDVRNAAQRAARANQHFADTLTQFLDSDIPEKLAQLDLGGAPPSTAALAQGSPPTTSPAEKPQEAGQSTRADKHEDIDLASELDGFAFSVADDKASDKDSTPSDSSADTTTSVNTGEQAAKSAPENPFAKKPDTSSASEVPMPQSTQSPTDHMGERDNVDESRPPHQDAAAAAHSYGSTTSYPATDAPQPSLFERMMASDSIKDSALVKWWQREETVTKVLAVLGGIITIIGLVFLAMLAYASGILGPRSSVILAAVICVVIFASAFKARKNNPDGVLGPALIVVAILGGLADLWVAVFGLEWYSPVLGSVITTMLVIVGMLVAYTWNHEKLGVILTALSPIFILPVAINVLSDAYFSPAFAGCILATALVAFAVRWGNEWPALHMTASIVFIIGVALTYDNPMLTLLAGAVGVALLMIFSYDQPVVERNLEILSWIAFLLVPTFMCINSSPYHYIFTGAVFVAMLAWVASNGGHARFVVINRKQAEDNASIGFYVACVALGISMLREYVDTSQGIYAMVFMAVALGITYAVPRTEPRAAIIAIFAGLLLVFSDSAMAWGGSGKGPEGTMTWESVVLIIMGAALAVGMVLKRKELDQLEGGMEFNVEVVLYLVALFQISAVVPAVFLLISPTEISYMVAQLVISVAWMFCGIQLINRKGEAYRKAGLTLTLLATAKLVFFDLSVLGGMVQVIAFIVSGVILLVAAFNREKILKNDPASSDFDAAQQQGPHGGPQQQDSQVAPFHEPSAPQGSVHEEQNPYSSKRS